MYREGAVADGTCQGKSESESHSVVSDSLQPHGLYSSWNSPGQNTEVGSCSLIQGIFPTQVSNPGLLHCKWILYQLSHRGSPHARKVMLKILQARLQQYVNHELPDIQAAFRKSEEPEIKLPTSILWIIKKAREFQKNIYFCFIDYAKAFDCVDHNKLWKILKEMGIPDHLTCLLRNLYASQEATVRTGHGTTD